VSTTAVVKEDKGAAKVAYDLMIQISKLEDNVNELPRDERRAYVLDLMAECVQTVNGYRSIRSK